MRSVMEAQAPRQKRRTQPGTKTRKATMSRSPDKLQKAQWRGTCRRSRHTHGSDSGCHRIVGHPGGFSSDRFREAHLVSSWTVRKQTGHPLRVSVLPAHTAAVTKHALPSPLIGHALVPTEHTTALPVWRRQCEGWPGSPASRARVWGRPGQPPSLPCHAWPGVPRP